MNIYIILGTLFLVIGLLVSFVFLFLGRKNADAEKIMAGLKILFTAFCLCLLYLVFSFWFLLFNF